MPGSPALDGEIVVFADARQRFAPDALIAARPQFRGSAVGGVTGELVLDCEAQCGGWLRRGEGVGLYWKYENGCGATRAASGPHWGPPGPSTRFAARCGALCRRRRCSTMCWRRCASCSTESAWFSMKRRAPSIASAERRRSRRKTRTLAGNYQILALEPRLLPGRQPCLASVPVAQVGRLMVPWALLGSLFASAGLMFDGRLSTRRLRCPGAVLPGGGIWRVERRLAPAADVLSASS